MSEVANGVRKILLEHSDCRGDYDKHGDWTPRCTGCGEPCLYIALRGTKYEFFDAESWLIDHQVAKMEEEGYLNESRRSSV